MPVVTEPDHLRIARERQLEIVRAMSPTQRLQRAFAMNHSMRTLLAAGFRTRHSDWTPTQVDRAVADRILHARTD